MLNWAFTFLIIALLAGLLGMWAVAGTAAWIAKMILFIFLVLVVVSMMRRARKA